MRHYLKLHTLKLHYENSKIYKTKICRIDSRLGIYYLWIGDKNVNYSSRKILLVDTDTLLPQSYQTLVEEYAALFFYNTVNLRYNELRGTIKKSS